MIGTAASLGEWNEHRRSRPRRHARGADTFERSVRATSGTSRAALECDAESKETRYAAVMATSPRLSWAVLILSLGCGDATSGSGSGGSGGDDGGGASGPSTSSGTPIDCADAESHTGEGTYYDADGSGNCSFDASSDLLVAAMNESDYASSALCGGCIAVSPKGDVVVRIVDRCPECPEGDVDMSPEAFGQIAEIADGRVPITWHLVSCGTTGPIQYRFKEGSNPYWTAVQIRNTSNPILSVEAKVGDAYVALARESYNYFIADPGLGEGPYAFRVTDLYGNVIEDPAVPFGEATAVDSASQFPACD